MEILPVQTLRESMSEYLAQAESGHAFLIRRHAEPLAILRPLREDDAAEDVPVSRFRTHLTLWLKRARRTPLRLTWRGTRVAVVEGVRPRSQRGHRS